MSALIKDEFTIAISSDIAMAIQNHYGKEDYSLMVENFLKLMLPKKREIKNSSLSTCLRGCASSSGFVDKTEKEIKDFMYKEKYRI